MRVGDLLLLRLDAAVQRPFLVTEVGEGGHYVHGTIFCEPADHTREAFRGGAWGVTGHPDRLFPFGRGEGIIEGSGIGHYERTGSRL